jgi:H+/Cl- antiporter ClcA
MSAPPSDPVALLRSGRYLGLLVVAAVLGVPISAAAYGFLALVTHLQGWTFSDLPQALGFAGTPWWWPLPLLTLAGVLVAATIRWLPGGGGHSRPTGSRPAGHRRRSSSPGSRSRRWRPSALARCWDPRRR